MAALYCSYETRGSDKRGAGSPTEKCWDRKGKEQRSRGRGSRTERGGRERRKRRGGRGEEEEVPQLRECKSMSTGRDVRSRHAP
eukprot:760167-Hanusia_phi.AAC.5